jgi:predicted DNA-binding antitoxin AbrB/MazE fold protein
VAVKAIYRDGVFKPTVPVDLPEGTQVDLEVTPTPSPGDGATISLQGIWKDALRPEDEGDWVSQTVADVREESAARIDRLARDLSNHIARE